MAEKKTFEGTIYEVIRRGLWKVTVHDDDGHASSGTPIAITKDPDPPSREQELERAIRKIVGCWGTTVLQNQIASEALSTSATPSLGRERNLGRCEPSPVEPQSASVSQVAPVAGVPWRPIATAPKDGSEVLIFVPDYEIQGAKEFIAVGRFQAGAEFDGLDRSPKWEGGPPSWSPKWTTDADDASNGEHGFWADGMPYQPTHWMPLPDAPVGDLPGQSQEVDS